MYALPTDKPFSQIVTAELQSLKQKAKSKSEFARDFSPKEVEVYINSLKKWESLWDRWYFSRIHKEHWLTSNFMVHKIFP